MLKITPMITHKFIAGSNPHAIEILPAIPDTINGRRISDSETLLEFLKEIPIPTLILSLQNLIKNSEYLSISEIQEIDSAIATRRYTLI